MEEELREYFQNHTSKKVANDNGVRISNTKLYFETIAKKENKKTINELAKHAQNSLFFNNLEQPIDIEAIKPKNTPSTSTACVTQAEVHQAVEPEIILPFSKEVCRTASIVLSPPIYVLSSQTLSCDVIDHSGDDVIITHEVQHFSKNKHQNSNYFWWKSSKKRKNTHESNVSAISASGFQHKSTMDICEDNCSQTNPKFGSKKQSHFKELPLFTSITLPFSKLMKRAPQLNTSN